jgi:hypothetical protein
MFRFTIRNVLWLTSLVAMGVVWLVDHARQNRRLMLERDANVEAAARVQVEWLRRYRGEIPSTPTPSP